MRTKFFSNLRSSILVAAGSLLLGASVVHAQGVFSDNFDTAGADSNFTNVSGSTSSSATATWTANNGFFSVTSNTQPYNFSLLTTAGDTNYANFTLSYDVTASYDGGIMLHSDAAAANGITFIVRPDAGDAYFTTRTGGNFQAGLGVTSISSGAMPGSSLHVVLTAQGNNYTAVISTTANPTAPIAIVNVNDGLGNNQTTAAYTTGYVGFYCYGSGQGLDHYDNFAINVPEPSTWAMLGLGVVGMGVAVARCRRAC